MRLTGVHSGQDLGSAQRALQPERGDVKVRERRGRVSSGGEMYQIGQKQGRQQAWFTCMQSIINPQYLAAV